MREKSHQFSLSESSSSQHRPLSKQPTRAASIPVHTAISFDDYVHYAAPKSSNIKSLYPPAAVTLGRNAFDRFGDQISDFEVISSNGDRIPVSMAVLLKRWGKYFALLLARSYVLAAEDFEAGLTSKLTGEWAKLRNESSDNLPSKNFGEIPHFRIPFQDSKESLDKPVTTKSESTRKTSMPQTHELPPQPPLPNEPLPPVPQQTTFKSTSRAGSQDHSSPRASLMHTLSVLRNIPTTGKSPRESPFSSPRASYSAQGSGTSSDLRSSPFPNLRPNIGRSTSELKLSSVGSGISTQQSEETNHRSGVEDNHEDENEEEDEVGSLDSEYESEELITEKKSYPMEPALIPRKLYIPFSTNSVKVFCEFLYTGQLGHKCSLSPTLLDNFMISKFYKIPILYESILDILINIIKRREDEVLKNINSEIRLKYDEFIYFLNKGEIKKEILEKFSNLNNVEDNVYDEKNSNENDKDSINLAYLESENLSIPIIGPRFKSVFDRSSSLKDQTIDDNNFENDEQSNKTKLNLITIEELVDPNSSIPISDDVMQAILNAAILVNEMKIILRVNICELITKKGFML
ncbi:MDS3 [Candida pseudojiufengensis]|uniref:MDS3 n=1 Tax=Candida pseudojiufengensis TaxID=497109 RepID=UPI002224E029|nr:MDS3 [Candida pseudojiufengensis]KAI5967819.1 MDS3 [Candida pseudojiufengensis]